MNNAKGFLLTSRAAYMLALPHTAENHPVNVRNCPLDCKTEHVKIDSGLEV